MSESSGPAFPSSVSDITGDYVIIFIQHMLDRAKGNIHMTDGTKKSFRKILMSYVSTLKENDDPNTNLKWLIEKQKQLYKKSKIRTKIEEQTTLGIALEFLKRIKKILIKEKNEYNTMLADELERVVNEQDHIRIDDDIIEYYKGGRRRRRKKRTRRRKSRGKSRRRMRGKRKGKSRRKRKR